MLKSSHLNGRVFIFVFSFILIIIQIVFLKVLPLENINQYELNLWICHTVVLVIIYENVVDIGMKVKIKLAFYM
jgi:hypothetical protein